MKILMCTRKQPRWFMQKTVKQKLRYNKKLNSYKLLKFML